MSFSYGNKLKITLFGQSHSEAIGIIIDGLPSGYEVDNDKICKFLSRRSGTEKLSTSRREVDVPCFLSGIADGKTCGAPLTAVLYNKDVRSSDYLSFSGIPRPSHADFVAVNKFGNYDFRGGGQFSGRMTAPICIVGAILIDLLLKSGIVIKSRIKSIHGINDDGLDLARVSETDFDGMDTMFPTINEDKADKMKEEILSAKQKGDSVGGEIECFVFGMPIGVGEPFFDSLESEIAKLMFSVPAVKGIAFGNVDCINLYGSENNDGFRMNENKVVTETNNSGGINGGISNGMPIAFTVAIKPTPSISIKQHSVDMQKKENVDLTITGRHDPCIVPRAAAVIESMTAIAIYNLLK